MHDLIIVSDQHLGRGKNAETGRHFNLEAFFYDEDFARFCRSLCEDAAARGVPFKLILNGDIFDFLRIEPEDPGPQASVWDRRYGMPSTPAAAARIARQILDGHPRWVDGITTILTAGHDVVFLPGNHDNEMQWASVQAVIRDRLRDRLGALGADADAALAHLSFRPWFYYEPGRIWVEHGCQYDPENSFRYPLRQGLEQLADPGDTTESDLPLGNFIQRYLYNGFGHITFIVPSAKANLRYTKWLLVNQPRFLARVIAKHVPFSFQVVKRLAQAIGSRSRLEEIHARELEALVQAGEPGEKLRRIDALKAAGEELEQTVRSLGMQFVKSVALAIFISLMAAGLWFLGQLAIQHMEGGFGFKTFLFLALNFLMLAGAFVGVGYILLKTPASVRPHPLRFAAQGLVDLLDVPLVTFGHTHDEVVWRLQRPSGEKAWYYSTGTWIAVFTHDVLLPRERVQFTFLRVRGQEAELLYWSPSHGEPQPVIVLDEETSLWPDLDLGSLTN
jgi:UDP-2,3-diacylglucosamine pyrophosphatase LpxH